jgi:hypothetical protein
VLSIDGRLSIRYNGVELAYRTFDKSRQVDQGGNTRVGRTGAPVLASSAVSRLRTEIASGAVRPVLTAFEPPRLSISAVRPGGPVRGKQG